jgi:hypothetical protein
VADDKAEVDNKLAGLQRSADQKIAEAETHLGVAHGTLADVARDTDYLAILKIHATIEPLINELLEENITRVLKHPKVNFPGGDTLAEFVVSRNLDDKRKLAVKCELISQSRSDFIRHIANVRNRYAHNIKNIPLSIYEVAQKVSPKDNGATVLKSLYGLTDSTPQSRLAHAFMRPLLYWNFAWLLSAMIQGIKPPVWDGQGQFGILNSVLRDPSAEPNDGNVQDQEEDGPEI